MKLATPLPVSELGCFNLQAQKLININFFWQIIFDGGNFIPVGYEKSNSTVKLIFIKLRICFLI